MRSKTPRDQHGYAVASPNPTDTPELPEVKRPGWVYAVIAVLVAVSLVLLWVTTTAALGKPERGKGWNILYGSHSLMIPVGPDAWRGPYNRGTAAATRGDYVSASNYLATAFGRVPAASANEKGSKAGTPECQVRMNYSLSLEAEGDAAWENAQTGDANADRLARQKFTEAARISKPCTSDGSGGQALATPEDVIHQRQTNKPPENNPDDNSNSSDDPSPPPSDSPSDSPSDDPSSPNPSEPPSPEPDPSPSTESEQEKKLRERREQAEQDYQDRQSGKGPGYGRGKNW